MDKPTRDTEQDRTRTRERNALLEPRTPCITQAEPVLLARNPSLLLDEAGFHINNITVRSQICSTCASILSARRPLGPGTSGRSRAYAGQNYEPVEPSKSCPLAREIHDDTRLRRAVELSFCMITSQKRRLKSDSVHLTS